jgi:hypothetical protein
MRGACGMGRVACSVGYVVFCQSVCGVCAYVSVCVCVCVRVHSRHRSMRPSILAHFLHSAAHTHTHTHTILNMPSLSTIRSVVRHSHVYNGM